MSVYEFNRPAPLGAITTHRVVTWVEAMIEALRTWRSARLTEAALYELTDSQLADIGLYRGAIPEVASALARR